MYAYVSRVDVALLHIADDSGKGLLHFGIPRHAHISRDLASCTPRVKSRRSMEHTHARILTGSSRAA